MDYHQWGGREKNLKAKVESGVGEVKGKAEEVADKAKDGLRK
jgi:hypothetical protein